MVKRKERRRLSLVLVWFVLTTPFVIVQYGRWCFDAKVTQNPDLIQSMRCYHKGHTTYRVGLGSWDTVENPVRIV